MSEVLVHSLVAGCMKAPAISIGPYDSLAVARESMATHGVRRLPVVHDGKLTGIITLSDLLRAQTGDPARRVNPNEIVAELDRLTVVTTMTRDPVCVFDNDTVGRAAELMLEHKIGGLPVVDVSQALVGVVTESDIFRLLAERWRADNVIFSGAH